MPTRKRKRAKKAPIFSAVANSPLFKLSGEVRNIIWRFVLVSDDPLVFTSSGVDEARLLQTCHAIRKEAAGIFYLENRTECPGGSYNSTALLKYQNKLSSLNLPDQVPGLAMFDINDKSWSHLKLWLKRIHSRDLRWCPEWPSTACAHDCAISAMFWTAETLMDLS
ncbi:hypothetical protein LTR95_004895 [Oleoguttula sp. CCFEE 5521]